MNFIVEMFRFLRSKKKLWLLPLVFVAVMFGALLFVAKGSVFGPFIYTLF